MITQTDLEINRAVRRIMVKHWIDLGCISVRTAKRDWAYSRAWLFNEVNRLRQQ